uniref:SH3 domain-containing protein n=1 Tax=Parastrongyloides trichosuri TaxID=131310 RepID=A0A0N4ZJB8_PARTI
MCTEISSMSTGWGCLFDNPENVLNYSLKGIEIFERFGNLIKDRAVIEEEYANKLRNLTRKNIKLMKNEDDSFTFVTSFNTYINEINSLAAQHEMIAEKMKKDISNDISTKCHNFRQIRKGFMCDLTKAQTDLQSEFDHLAKQLKYYTKAFKDAEGAYLKFDKAEKNMDLSRAELAKAKSNAETKHQYCREAYGNYIKQLEKGNKLHEDFYTIKLPELLNNIKKMDIDRIIETKNAIHSSVRAETDVINVIQRCYNDMNQAATSIDPDKDTGTVVTQYRTGYTYKTPAVEVNFGCPSHILKNGVSAVTSEAGESTVATLKRGVLSNGNNNTMKNGSSKIGRKQSMHQKIFGGDGKSKQKENGNTAFSNDPPQQKLRKCQEKLDSVEKEIIKIESSKKGLQKMISVYEENPKLGDPKVVSDQLKQYDIELAHLKKEQSLYLSLIDETKSQLQLNLSIDSNSTPRNPSISSGISPRTSSNTDSPITTPRTTRVDRTSYDAASLSSEASSAKSVTNNSNTSGSVGSNNGKNTSNQAYDPNTEVYDICELPPLGTAIALYAFDGSSEGTVPLKEGEELLILEKDEGDGWTRIKNKTGEREGFVPTTYLRCTYTSTDI